MGELTARTIETLLADDDPRARQLACQQLIKSGADVVPVLRQLLDCRDGGIARQAREIIASIERVDRKAEFAEVCRRCEEFDIEDCGWALARVFEPAADIPRYRARLDDWAAEVAPEIGLAGTPVGRVNALAGCLADGQGLTGNVDNYYSPMNSLLTAVIDSRRGNPIALCTLYMLVGRRAGMQVDGINAPGHFLARHDGVYFDPFHNGRVLPSGEIRMVLDQVEPAAGALLIESATTALILRRMLGNLEQIFHQAGDLAYADMLAEWILILDRK
mgnify:CR=1 FL=1